eukprot:g2072.t1
MSEYHDLNRNSAPTSNIEKASSEKSEASARTTLERTSGPPELTRTSVTAFLERRSVNLARSSVNRAERELVQRSHYSGTCNVTFGIRDVHSGNAVHYKFDGTRFQHADATIKVLYGVTYEIRLSIKPNMDLTNNLLYLRSFSSGSTAKQHVVSLSQTRVDGPSISGSWKCELDPNKKSERISLELSGKITHFGEFTLPLLLKVYPANSRGAAQGFRLKKVVFELGRNLEEDAAKVRVNSLRYIS